MSKVEQKAEQLFKDGQKALKTGFFKWNPDYVSAVQYFEDSGIWFK